jgi:F0F1-type ATP synthase delta subunit
MTAYSYDRVVDELKTSDDMELFLAEIDMLLVSLYQNNVSAFKETLDTKLQRRLGDILTHSLQEQKINFTDHEQLQYYFTGLKAYVTQLPLLHLTLAYHPTNQQILGLSEWARQVVKRPVILHLNYNKMLLGGAVISFGGSYKDLSLKKKLDTVYQTKREELLAIIK